ncbi:uncharacterized protein Z518_06506 [Rhinocladiella mackenziei CBS 650.93]|uniref:Rhinocladiella mackenziei CBS 650.93 unplaced genomic scaffold supercont1.5, whole genome shotgun sequence n=1 Tax=Rhinocladiella mackenziei CBS 650.93 TaxID=1442369 RepID=A0A0D2II65_9EURO|nr:uncharacterized protein Z518_06506 [Rhinocladiella mackenziei CBS 650.93]KIX02956.1 hypothetical protein Z518_06506 [Rhinocladiella mackenziei CBS 650.93]
MSVPSLVSNDTFIVGGGGQDDNAMEGPNRIIPTIQSATIGITDKILTGIPIRETAFVIDMQQIAISTKVAYEKELGGH